MARVCRRFLWWRLATAPNPARPEIDHDSHKKAQNGSQKGTKKHFSYSKSSISFLRLFAIRFVPLCGRFGECADTDSYESRSAVLVGQAHHQPRPAPRARHKPSRRPGSFFEFGAARFDGVSESETHVCFCRC